MYIILVPTPQSDNCFSTIFISEDIAKNNQFDFESSSTVLLFIVEIRWHMPMVPIKTTMER